ncbi:MAG: GrpB family protein [Bdellovibrionaceae bacterium]|nr:GrpB family protein [Pseudobdellovibrionaceae bacterium]
MTKISTRGEELAIQLIEAGSEFEMFITFRDILLADAKLLKSYNELKLGCTGLDQTKYRARKSEFIQKVLGESRQPKVSK